MHAANTKREHKSIPYSGSCSHVHSAELCCKPLRAVWLQSISHGREQRHWSCGSGKLCPPRGKGEKRFSVCGAYSALSVCWCILGSQNVSCSWLSCLPCRNWCKSSSSSYVCYRSVVYRTGNTGAHRCTPMQSEMLHDANR
jgi:hypothetical protein